MEEQPKPPQAPETSQPDKKKSKEYPPEFFDLQIKFAEAVRRASPGMILANALFNFTALYRRFELPKPNDPENQTWKQFIARIETGEEPSAVAYEFYRSRSGEAEAIKEKERKQFGAFQSEVKGDVVKIHVKSFPREEANRSSLRQSLTELFTDVKRNHPEVKTVSGESWLFRRSMVQALLPQKFIKSAKPAPQYFGGNAIWGQLLNGDKQLKPKMAEEFLKKLPGLKLENIPALFPYPNLKAECNIEEFYRFYGIK